MNTARHKRVHSTLAVRNLPSTGKVDFPHVLRVGGGRRRRRPAGKPRLEVGPSVECAVDCFESAQTRLALVEQDLYNHISSTVTVKDHLDVRRHRHGRYYFLVVGGLGHGDAVARALHAKQTDERPERRVMPEAQIRRNAAVRDRLVRLDRKVLRERRRA